MTAIVGVVPNFSEGRRRDVIDAIVDALDVEGARVVFAEADPDHHRLDTTVLGRRRRRAALGHRRGRRGGGRIDMFKHRGGHPGWARRTSSRSCGREVAWRSAWTSPARSDASWRRRLPARVPLRRGRARARAALAGRRAEGRVRGAAGGGRRRRPPPGLRPARDRPGGRDGGGRAEAAGRVQHLPVRRRRGGGEGDRSRRSASPRADFRPSGRSASRSRSEDA